MGTGLLLGAGTATPTTGGGFVDPTSIANLIEWNDLTDTGAVTLVSGNISSVSDKSGHSNVLAQATIGLRPGYGTTAAPNSAHTALLNGSTYLMSALTHNQPLTIIVACKSSQAGSFICDGQSGRNALAYLNSTASSGTNKLCMYAGTGLGNDGISDSVNLDIVVTGVFNGASSRLRRNGTQIASGTAGAANDTGGLYLGAGQSGFFLNGYIGQVGIYTGDPGDTNIALVENYFATSLGIVF